MSLEKLAGAIKEFQYDDSINKSHAYYQDQVILNFINELEQCGYNSEANLNLFFNLLGNLSPNKNNPFYHLFTEYDSYLMSIIDKYVIVLGNDKFSEILNTTILSKVHQTKEVILRLFSNLFYYENFSEILCSISKEVLNSNINNKKQLIDILEEYKKEMLDEVQIVNR